jgi:hypothetical protein
MYSTVGLNRGQGLGFAASLMVATFAVGCASEGPPALGEDGLTESACPEGSADTDKDPKNGCEDRVCRANESKCSSACTDLAKDVLNCGACGNACTYSGEDGEAYCDQARCAIRCYAGTILIGGRCVWEAD